MKYCFQVLLPLSLLIIAAPASSQIEISYDDGTAETGIVREVGVRFTVDEPLQLVGGRFFVITAQPTNSLGVIVLDANGVGSAPGDTLFGPDTLAWNGTDLSFTDYQFPNPVEIPGTDFYVVYFQTMDGPLGQTPVLGLDLDPPFHHRSWKLINNVWTQIQEDINGKVMIRAVVLDPTPVEAVSWGLLKIRAMKRDLGSK